MKKHTVANRQTTVGKRNEICLDYSLILTDSKEVDIFGENTVFSILILQLEDGITTEYDFLYDVARDRKNAVAIFDLMVYNNVMPSNARDVLADCL